LNFKVEEEKEFTALNAGAYDIHRKSSRENDSIPPCWLCMSEPAKEEARQEFYKWLDKNFPRDVFYDSESATRFLSIVNMDGFINQWKIVELDRKKQRELGNLSAYFME
jgi:hypothetical protein